MEVIWTASLPRFSTIIGYFDLSYLVDWSSSLSQNKVIFVKPVLTLFLDTSLKKKNVYFYKKKTTKKTEFIFVATGATGVKFLLTA